MIIDQEVEIRKGIFLNEINNSMFFVLVGMI